MKLPFIPLLIGAVCIGLTLSLIILHITTASPTSKYHPAAKSFHLETPSVNAQNLRTAPPVVDKVEQLPIEVHSPTLPPLPVNIDNVIGGQEEDKPASSDRTAQDAPEAKPDNELLRPLAVEAEEKVPALPPVQVVVAPEIPQRPAFEEPPVVVPPADAVLPPTAAPTSLVVPLYYAKLTVEAGDTANAFLALRSHHNAALQAAVQAARDSADVILPRDISTASDASLTELAESSFEFYSLERLHRALRTGAACKRPSQSVWSNSLYQTAQTLFDAKAGSVAYRAKTIIEYVPGQAEASSTVSFALAAAYPTVTALQLRFPQTGDSPTASSVGAGAGGSGGNSWQAANVPCSADRPGSNLYVAEGRGNPLDRAEQHRFDCVQLVPDMEMLVGNLLPFEFEEMLGNILCRCNATFIPQSLPNSAYFAFWDSTSHLLSSAEKVIPSSCAISYDMGSTASSWASGVRNSHIVVQRNDSLPAPEASSTSSAWSWSSSSSSTSSDKPSPAEVQAAAKRYLSVGLLSSLDLDVRSRQNLWASVFLHRSAQGGGDTATGGNTTSVADLLVRGAVVHTPEEVVALSDKRRRKGMHLMAGEAQPGRTRSARAQPPSEEQRRSALASAPTEFDPASDSVNATADAVAPVVPVPATEVLHNAAEPSRRKLIYVASASVVSRSSAQEEDTLPREKSALTWEYPENGSTEYDAGDSGIEAALAAIAESGDPAFTTQSDPFRTSSTQYSISSASRTLQRHLHARESDSYRRWMVALRAIAPGEVDASRSGKSGTELVSTAGLVYVMGRHVSLLSLKLSKLLSSVAGPSHSAGILVSLLSDPLAYRSHALLTNMMSLQNNIICRPRWTPATIAALLVSPERAALSVVQVDVVTELIVGSLLDTGVPQHHQLRGGDCGVQLLEETLAGLLSMSDVSFIELPSSAQLGELFTDLDLSEQCRDALRTRYATNSAHLLKRAVAQLTLGASAMLSEVPLTAAGGETAPVGDGVRVFRVDLRHTSAVVASAPAAKFARKSSSSGLSLYTALQLGIIEKQKVQLLKMLLDFPLWKFKPSQHVRPWELFIQLVDAGKAGQGGRKNAVTWSVYYVSEDESAGGSNGAIDAVSRNHAVYAARLRSPGDQGSSPDGQVGVSGRGNNPSSDRVQGRAVWKALEYELESHGAELAEGRFSFVEHSSGFGYVSLRLAKSFPNATVISLEREPPKVAHHIAMANALGVLNNAVCWKTESDATIFRNIYESPELFRFQLLSRSLLDNFIDTESLADWGAMMGTLLSTALTSFVYAPHSAQVSWAMYVLFAEVFEFVPAGRSVGGSRPIGGGSGAKVSSFRRYALPAVVRPLSDVFGGGTNSRDEGVLATLVGLNSPAFHPQYPYRDFEKQWVLRDARVKGGSTAVHLSALAARDRLSDTSKDQLSAGFGIPIVRCDIVNMTRHVHHHYDYAKDGHSRTYTMRVRVNQTLSDAILSNLGDPSRTLARSTEGGIMLSTATQHGHGLFPGDRNSTADAPLDGILLPLGYHPNQHNVVGVHLFRDRDTFPIPYTHIYGVTLISALRMGLEESLRDRLFKDFLRMPLYEDMAPWNIVLMGPSVDYIDYDTRDITFNKVVPQAYQVMTVLMNYKRTVEDFKRCGSKASTVYGLPYVSDCVGTYGDRSLSCPDLKLPVPCADGNCHSDYISCLRAITAQAEDIAQQQQRQRAGVESALAAHVENHSSAVVDSNIVAAMKSIVGQFNDRTASARSYEEFFSDLQQR